MSIEEPKQTGGVTPEQTLGATPEQTPGATPERTSGATPEQTPGPTLERAPGATPEQTPGVTHASRGAFQAPAERVLVIGNSDGIGLATTRLLLERGFRVVGISRRASPVSHGSYTHFVHDVSAPDYADALRDLLARHGAFGICIYCAGIGVPFDATKCDADIRVFEVNLLGAVRTVEAVLPSMLLAQRGHIVVLSSQADELVSSHAPSYSASKAALSSYFEGIGLALRDRGIHVTNVRFGFVDTKMAKASRLPFMITPTKAAEAVVRSLEDRPLRITYPLRMAVLVSFLRWAVGWKIRLSGAGRRLRT